MLGVWGVLRGGEGRVGTMCLEGIGLGGAGIGRRGSFEALHHCAESLVARRKGE